MSRTLPTIFLLALAVGAGIFLGQSGMLSEHQKKLGDVVEHTRELMPGAAKKPPAPPVSAPLAGSDLPPNSIRAPAKGFNEGFIKVALPQAAEAGETINIPGKLALNAKKVHIVSGRLDGRIEKIHVFEGEQVKAGQPVAELFSPDYVSAQYEFLLAHNTEQTFHDAGLKSLEEDAEATEQSARTRLMVLGAAKEDVDKLERTEVVEHNLILRSNIEGVVIKRNLDPGAFLKVGDPLMSIGNMDDLWFYGNVYERDYSKIRLGETLKMSSKALPGRIFKGVVSFISTSIDPTTRTLPIRCDVPNPQGDLRPELFVTAELEIGRANALIVPKEAVVEIADVNYVIIEKEPGLYQRIPVTAMPYDDNHIAISSGLHKDQKVLVEGVILVSQMIDNQKLQ